MDNKKQTWENLYKRSDFDKEVARIKSILSNKELIKEYYSFAKLMLDNNLKVKSCVEFGAGTGQYSLILKKLGLIETATLIDWDKNVLGMAKDLFTAFHEKCEIIEADLLKFNSGKKYDLCISGGLIEHFKGDEQKRIVDLHKSIARYSILEYPFNTPTYWIMRTLMTIKNGFSWPFGYEKPFSREDEEKFFGKDEIINSGWHTLIPILSARIPFVRRLGVYKLSLFKKAFKMDHLLLLKNS